MTTSSFDRATLAFLAMLSINNEKAWFDVHRADFDAHYPSPALAFIDAIRAPLTEIEPDVHAEARVNRSLFWINRDDHCLQRFRPLAGSARWVAAL